MRKEQRTILSLLAVIVAAIVIVSIFVIKPGAEVDLRVPYSVRDLSVVDQNDHLQISFAVTNDSSQLTRGNGTATIAIVDDSSRTIFIDNLTFSESDFQNVSTPNGTEPRVFFDIPYEEVNRTMGGNITCSLSLSSKDWAANQTGVTISLPYALSALVYYRSAMPGDQENLMNGGQIEGGVSYEPYVSDMVEKGWGKVLLRSSEIWPNHPSYVLLLDKTWAANNADLAARVIRAHIEAEQWIQNSLANPGSANYTHLISKGMEISNKSQAVVAEALKHIKFSYELTDSTRTYVKLYTDGYIEEGETSNQNLTGMGYQTTQQFANSYVNSNYLASAMSVAPSSSILGNVAIGYVKGNIFMIPTYIALDKSIWGGLTAFEKYGVKADLPEVSGYNTSALVTRGLITGEVKVGFTGICPAILLHLNLKMNTIIAAQMTAEGTALVVKNYISSLEELDGKTIASVDPSTIQDVFLMYLAEQKGFRLTYLNGTSA